MSTLNTSGIHGPLPHTVSNLLDVLKSCIEAPDIEPHPTEGATEDEEEDTNYELQGNQHQQFITLYACILIVFEFLKLIDRASQTKFICQGSFSTVDMSEDSTVSFHTFNSRRISE